MIELDGKAALRAMYRPPAWVVGGISTEDAEFLFELVQELAPRLVLELGVAAGTSSAALLFALDQLPDARALYSADIRPTCYFDERRMTGAAVAEMYPAPPRRATWRLNCLLDARRAAEVLKLETIDLAWIDADHRHPWPLFDLLYLAPVLRPGAWVALHDIDLPRLYPQFQSHGPMWLFELWPGEKRQAAGSSNIGAVRLPADLGALVPMALALLQRPPEAAPSADGLAPVFAPIALAARRQGRAAGRQERSR